MWTLLVLVVCISVPQAVFGQCAHCMSTHSVALRTLTTTSVNCDGLRNYMACVVPCQTLMAESTYRSAAFAVQSYCSGKTDFNTPQKRTTMNPLQGLSDVEIQAIVQNMIKSTSNSNGIQDISVIVQTCSPLRTCLITAYREGMVKAGEQNGLAHSNTTSFQCRVTVPIYSCFETATSTCNIQQETVKALALQLSSLRKMCKSDNVSGEGEQYNFVNMAGCKILRCFSQFYAMDQSGDNPSYCKSAEDYLKCVEDSGPLDSCPYAGGVEQQVNIVRNTIETNCPINGAASVEMSKMACLLFVSALLIMR